LSSPERIHHALLTINPSRTWFVDPRAALVYLRDTPGRGCGGVRCHGGHLLHARLGTV